MGSTREFNYPSSEAQGSLSLSVSMGVVYLWLEEPLGAAEKKNISEMFEAFQDEDFSI